MDEQAVMDQAMAEARKVAEALIESRLKGLQRVIGRKDDEIRRLREQLAEQEEGTTND